MAPRWPPLALALAAGCTPDGRSGEPADAAASPQASAVPAPLALSATALTSAAPVSDAGPPPTPLHANERVDADPISREGGALLSGTLRWSELTGPPRAPEVSAAALEALRKKTELRLSIALAPSRMRVVFQGAGYVWPSETELRARADRYGHVAVWPGASRYRPVPPGALRAFLGERRFDVAPAAPAEILARDEPGKRIGVKTRKVEVVTRAGRIAVEIGRLDGLGEGGALLCRSLLELASAPPGTPLCGVDELPMRAELKWATQGALGFELTGVLRRADLPATAFQVPPAGATLGDAPASAPFSALLTPAELATFRLAPVDVPTATSPEEGLVAVNTSDTLRMLFLDGVPVAVVEPGARGSLVGLTRGRYVAQWRTFLGDLVDAPVAQVVPGVASPGGADAGLGRRAQ